MNRRLTIRKYVCSAAAVSAAWTVGRLMAADPVKPPIGDASNVQLVRQQPPPVQPPPVQPSTAPDAGANAPPSAEQFAPANLPGAAALGTATGGRAETNSVNPVAS